MALRSGRSHFTLATLPREDFPTSGPSDLPRAFELQAEELKTLIERSRFAISTEETRYYLNGIYLHAAQADAVEVLRAVATDGHRLARVEMPLPSGAEGMPGVIVPRKTVGEVYKLIEETDEPVRVSLSETKIRFAFNDTVLTSKLIDGTFPDYERVIPSNTDKTMEVDCRSFSQAVDRVSTISTEKSRAVKLALADGTVTLSATSPENGSAEEDVAVSYGGPPLEIGFNSRYLLDIAGQIEGDGAVFQLSDAASPTIVRDARRWHRTVCFDADEGVSPRAAPMPALPARPSRREDVIATSQAQTAAGSGRALWLSRLSLSGFRNFREVDLALDSRPLLLSGPNGAGKTNLLEAVSLLSPGRGLRGARLADLDRRGGSNAGPGSGAVGWGVAATVETPDRSPRDRHRPRPEGRPDGADGRSPHRRGAGKKGGEAGRRLCQQPASTRRGRSLRLADAPDGPSVRRRPERPSALLGPPGLRL